MSLTEFLPKPLSPHYLPVSKVKLFSFSFASRVVSKECVAEVEIYAKVGKTWIYLGWRVEFP